jgi:hypothetical protein
LTGFIDARHSVPNDECCTCAIGSIHFQLEHCIALQWGWMFGINGLHNDAIDMLDEAI